jgi:PAS domain S-box-containing protein
MLYVDQVATFIRDSKSPFGFSVAHSSGIDCDDAVPENLEKVLNENSFERGYVTAYDLERVSGPNPGSGGTDATWELTSAEELQYYVPCVVNERIVAVIGVGRTTSGAPLTTEDLELLRELSEYIAIPISNSLAYHSQTEMEERQRDTIVRELRDQMARESARRDQEISKLTRQLEQRTSEIKHLTDETAPEPRPNERDSGEYLYASIVENASIGILVIDEDGRITRWNREMTKVFDAQSAQALGRSIYDVIDSGLVQTIEAAVAQPISRISGARHIYKHRVVTKSERPLILNISLAPIVNGAARGTVVMIQDITDSLHLEQELRKDNGLRTIDVRGGESGQPSDEGAVFTDPLSSTVPRPGEASYFQKYSPRRWS